MLIEIQKYLKILKIYFVYIIVFLSLSYPIIKTSYIHRKTVLKNPQFITVSKQSQDIIFHYAHRVIRVNCSKEYIYPSLESDENLYFIAKINEMIAYYPNKIILHKREGQCYDVMIDQINLFAQLAELKMIFKK